MTAQVQLNGLWVFTAGQCHQQTYMEYDDVIVEVNNDKQKQCEHHLFLFDRGDLKSYMMTVIVFSQNTPEGQWHAHIYVYFPEGEWITLTKAPFE